MQGRRSLGAGRRPVLDLPRTPLEKAIEAGAGLATAAVATITLLAWPYLPDRVPVHFGVTGRPDAWASRPAFAFLPAVAAALYVGLSVLQRYPHIYNYPWPITPENAAVHYRLARQLMAGIKLEVSGFFAVLQWSATRVARGMAETLPLWLLPLFVGVLGATLGAYLAAASRRARRDASGRPPERIRAWAGGGTGLPGPWGVRTKESGRRPQNRSPAHRIRARRA